MKYKIAQSSFKRLWYHITLRRRKQLALLLIVMVLASFAEVVSIGAVLPFLGVLMSPDLVFASPIAQPLVKALGLDAPRGLLFPLTAIFILAALISGTIRIFLLWAQTRLGFAIGADLSSQIYKKTLYQPYSVHISRNSSQIISAVSTKTNAVIYSTLLPLLSIVSSSLILVSILIALISINPQVAIVAFFGFGIVYGLIVFGTKRRLAYDSDNISHQSNQVIKALQEGLGGIRDVLIDGTQATYYKIYRDADLPLRNSQANIQIISGSPRFLIESFGMALIALLAYGLSIGGDGITAAIPVLGALAVGAQRLLPVLQQVYSGWASIRGNDSILVDVLELLDQKLSVYADKSLSPSLPFVHSIKLDRVSYRYTKDGPYVLKDIDIEIKKGSRVGFIGTTGSGKSTLVDLIMGLLHPTSGVLSVDGALVTVQNERQWQEHIAHVPQSIFLTDGTIAENIAFGVPADRIDHSRVRSASRQAQIAEVIEDWPQAYNTLVGERGIRLSGGQRQRIGIARALYKQAKIIVFDEATSALDNETEDAVMQAIEGLSQDITLLIIAHRLTTLKSCNQLLELQEGRVKYVGSYSDIIKTA